MTYYDPELDAIRTDRETAKGMQNFALYAGLCFIAGFVVAVAVMA